MKEPTDRQLEVFRAYLETQSVKQAAFNVGITNQSARNRLRELYARLGVHGAIEATIRLGWMVLPPSAESVVLSQPDFDRVKRWAITRKDGDGRYL